MTNPTPRVAQDQQADDTSEKIRKQQMRDLFAWWKQVNRDPDLEKSDFKIAFVIGDHINRDKGEAWPALETIAEECAVTKATVIAAVRRLTDAGYLAVDPGRAGRGHSSRYRRVLKKVQPLNLLPEPKRYSGREERAFGALACIFHKGSDIPNRADVWKLFGQVIDHGFDAEGLIDEATEYAASCDPETVTPLRDWLQKKISTPARVPAFKLGAAV